ncbi:MAG: insulinase family protein [Bacteroidetes bacterium]|nr:MAG: insulinase family protein [Bacteroidota bacterium]
MLDRTIAPPIHPVDSINLLPLQTILLPNQMPLYYLHSPESEIIQLSFVFKAGYIHQHKKLITTAFSSLLTSGTLHHSAKEIAEMLEQEGIFYSIEPSAAHTKIQFTFLKKNINNILPVLEEIIKYANFPEDEINLYVKNQIEQYQTKIKNVSFLAQWNYSKIIYGDHHPLNKWHTPQDYQNITRDDLLYFFTTHLHPNNGFIIISGNIDDNTLNLIETRFGKEPFHQTQHQHTEEVPPPQSYDKHITIQMPDALQSAIRIGMDINLSRKSEDYFDFMIANTLLGGYFGSRLMSVIREEKGYTYGINSGIAVYSSYSVFTIASEVKAEYTQAGIDEVIRQIQILQETPPDDEELRIVKNYLSGEILDATDGILKQDNVWKTLIINHLDKDYYNRFLQRIQSIQPEDISAVMKKYITMDKLKICIAGKKN